MANRLMNEQSLYLKQHAHNPVDWFPWGEEAFAHAKAQNKPVLVSIGYAACHWCHVMERESFENTETAAMMNQSFVCIKVDREEHPDVDDFYMSAVQTLTGSGGWPLNVFVTPDKLPFYGGTYFPPVPAHGRPSWKQLLERMAQVWQEHPGEALQQADQMLAHLQNAARQTTADAVSGWTDEDIATAIEALLKQADTVHGGFGRAPKFPSTMAIGLLLERARFTGDKDALRQALLSIDKMIGGGIYDQIGGGFSRYSVDAVWLVPHFEKMLYDNAMLLSVLTDAYQLTGKPQYRDVIEQTIAFLQREMRHPEGGYYAALDADSEGVEGKFYCWTIEEWNALMQGFPAYVAAYFGVEKEGNWEHTNILHRALDIQTICAQEGIPEAELTAVIREASAILLESRNKRIRPGTDDKILLGWNALLNQAFSKAGVVLKREDLIEEARSHMDWLLKKFEVAASPKHTWKEGFARIEAKLDDLAFLCRAMVQLSQALSSEAYLLQAIRLSEKVLQRFKAEDGPLLYYTSSADLMLPYRKPEIYDGVNPSSNAVMAEVLHVLGMLYENTEWIGLSEQMIQSQKKAAMRYPTSFAYWALLGQRLRYGYRSIVVTGNDQENIKNEVCEKFLPNCFYFFEKEENFVTMPFRKGYMPETYIFVCTKDACRAPLDRLPENIDFAIL
ncbi:MAG: thioredoxin domain-containing protein [Chitinophagaceae bacterium]